jgi:cytochrome c biogenesis protein CcmG/thiol:disulfide interchange protein DsbE
VLVIVVAGLTGCKKKADTPDDPNATVGNTEQASLDPLDTAASLFREPTSNLQNIIKAAKTWDTSFDQWLGKIAPDFTLTDIEGNVHTLSDYRGKNVFVVVWTTWCPTCKLEIPHLKELRSAFEDKDLAILSISNEPPALLKEFAAEQGITYTVLSGGSNLEAPFGEVQYIPSGFFIDREGRFKLATTGLVPTSDAKAIVQTQ